MISLESMIPLLAELKCQEKENVFKIDIIKSCKDIYEAILWQLFINKRKKSETINAITLLFITV